MLACGKGKAGEVRGSSGGKRRARGFIDRVTA